MRYHKRMTGEVHLYNYHSRLSLIVYHALIVTGESYLLDQGQENEEEMKRADRHGESTFSVHIHQDYPNSHNRRCEKASRVKVV